jgi:ABC-type antimicrobial peptide transport system permease subunit
MFFFLFSFLVRMFFFLSSCEFLPLSQAAPVATLPSALFVERLSQGLWAARMGAALLGLFGVLALILASIGIYGVLSYSVTQRTSEIGIRMALGAQTPEVLKLVLRQGMLLAGVGVLVGVAIALPITRFASSLLYGVSVWDPVTYISNTLLLMAVAFLACYVPARRATRIDPLVALRFE